MPGDTGWILWKWSTSSAPTAIGATTPVTGSNADQAGSTTLTGLTPDTTYHLIASGLFNDPFGGQFQSSTPEVTFTPPPA